jgi:hypothetical protein
MPQGSAAAGTITTAAALWTDDLVFDPAPAGTSVRGMAGENARRDAFRRIVNAIGGITVMGPRTGIRWRGQGDIDWRVTSAATRKAITGTALQKHESEMIAAARRVGMDNAQHLGDWEILARLRHNGAATRLIDITTDPFVALFMLCDPVVQDDTDARDGLLLAVNRTSLITIDRPWVDGSYERMLTRPERAALVYATPPIDPRIAAQRGEFMLSTDPLPEAQAPHCELFPINKPRDWSKRKLAKIFSDARLSDQPGRPLQLFPSMLGIRIPCEVKPLIRSVLDANFGYTREAIYPDWAGMGQDYTAAR